MRGTGQDRPTGWLQPLAMDVRSLAVFRIGVAAMLWNQRHTGTHQLVTLEIVFMARPVGFVPPYRAPRRANERQLLWEHGGFR